MTIRRTTVGFVFAMSFVLSSVASAQSLCEIGASIEVEWGGSWYPATVLAGPTVTLECSIHYDGYADSWDELVTPDRIRARAELGSCTVGAPVDVFWGETWYASSIIGGPNEAGECQIHYAGWDAQWDEWVGAERMRAKTALCVPGNNIQVLWNDTWYGANVVSGNDQSCMIHYDGYADSWDEAVGPERMRLAN